MPPPPGSVKSSQLCGDANYSRVRGEERPITTLLEPTSGLSLSLSLPRYIDQKMLNRREFLKLENDR